MAGTERKSVHRPEYDLLRELLAQARAASGLSQRQLSRRLAMPPTYVSKVERGERRVDALELIELVLAMDADPLPVLATLVGALATERDA